MTEPASTCTRCRHEGIVNPIQLDSMNNPISANNLRFVCPHCLHEWNADRPLTELQGRFLERAGLAP